MEIQPKIEKIKTIILSLIESFTDGGGERKEGAKEKSGRRTLQFFHLIVRLTCRSCEQVYLQPG